MIKKTVNYKNPFDGTPAIKDCYFNLNKAEITKMVMLEGEDMDDRLQKMIEARDTAAVLVQFEKLVGASYGVREGDEFIKTPEITQRFMSSEAYAELFVELITVPNAMTEFANGLMPKDLDKFVESLKANSETVATPAVAGTVEEGKDDRPEWLKEGRVPTTDELKNAKPEYVQEAFRLRAAQPQS